MRIQRGPKMALTIRLNIPASGSLTEGDRAIAVGPDNDHGTAACERLSVNYCSSILGRIARVLTHGRSEATVEI